MKFPAWVNGQNKTKQQKASARLKYIMTMLAAKHAPSMSMRGLADIVGLDHSTLSFYIRKGSFSYKAASRIVDALPHGEITIDALMNPLDIKPSP